MTPDEARSLLEEHGYIPGASKTIGMPRVLRKMIKEACQVLKEEARGMARPRGPEPTPPAPKSPRVPSWARGTSGASPSSTPLEARIPRARPSRMTDHAEGPHPDVLEDVLPPPTYSTEEG